VRPFRFSLLQDSTDRCLSYGGKGILPFVRAPGRMESVQIDAFSIE
jgi:hypothetical protein